jgi:hypothetical protein
MKNQNKNCYHLLENGYIHTSWLSLEDANEMLERYSRCYEDLEFSIFYAEKL